MKIIFSQKIKKEKDNFNNNIEYNQNYKGYQFDLYNPETSEYEELPEISPENLYQYLEDNYEEDEKEKAREDRIKEDLGIGVERLEEPPLEFPAIDVPEFVVTEEAMNWAERNKRVVRINYVTKKGTDLIRLIEPHGKFIAKNGNIILVTYDQTVGDIRAFIMENILNYIISGNKFNPKFKVIQKRGIKNMSNKIFQDLHKIGNDLELLKMDEEAETVTKIMRSFLNIKTAQYVGVQGYWIRNRRCFDNCYRQKRAQNKEMPAQDVWFECQKEYEDSINNDKSGWEKYADSGSPLIKTAEDQQKYILERENRFFQEKIQEKIKDDMSFPCAVYASLDQGMNRYRDQIIDDVDKLLEIINKLKEKGQEELAQKVADISMQMIKEAQWWQRAKDIGRGAWEGAKNLGKGLWEGAKGKVQQWEQVGLQTRIIPTVKKIQQYLQQLKTTYQDGWRNEIAKVRQMAAPLADTGDIGMQIINAVNNVGGNLSSIDTVVQQLATIISNYGKISPQQTITNPLSEATQQSLMGDYETQSINVGPEAGGYTQPSRKSVTPLQNYRVK